MNELFQVLAEKLKTVRGGSRAVAVLVGAALVAALGLTAVVSSRPHLEITFSNLSDHEVARVNKALSEAGIAFEVSQPPGPYTVFVDGHDRSAAFKAAYGAGALDKPLKGILSESGVASVFQGSEERLQAVRKREWQEMEGMLELLDFVVSARVRTSPGKASPLGSSPVEEPSASVTLRTVGGGLDEGHAQTIANLVSRGLGVPKARIVISDQTGEELFDGSGEDEVEERVADLLQQRERYDERATRLANGVLTEILGEGRARITVRSEWDYDQSTVRTESPAAKGGLLSETRSSTETPVERRVPVGGPAGIDANVASEEDAVATAAEPPEPLFATSSEEQKQYRPAVTTEERVRFVPRLERLSVALFLDESIDAELGGSLEEAIKAAVGFVPERDDFRSVRLPFAGAVPEGQGVEGGQAAPADVLDEPNPLVESLLERAVEIVVSLVFVGLLLKSLKGGAKRRSEGAPAGEGEGPGVDPELLARVRVEELLRAEPERVGEILSSWARTEDPLAGVEA